MRRLLAVGLALFGASACIDLFGPGTRNVSLEIVPVFDEFAAATIFDNADQVRVFVERDSAGTFLLVTQAQFPIDQDGEANIEISVVLLEASQEFRIRLEAFRESDGQIFFTAVQLITVTATADADGDRQQVTLPIQYAGPRGTRVIIAPRDTAMQVGDVFTLRAIVFDEFEVPVQAPVTFNLVNPRDTNSLRLGRVTGLAEAQASGAEVAVFVRTGDSLSDTTSVFIVEPLDPVAIRLDDGRANVAQGGTVQLSAGLVDRSGSVVDGEIEILWESRSTRVATVNLRTGGVTGVAPGTAVVVASGAGFSDSLVVTVAADGEVIVSTIPNGRSFLTTQIGNQIVVDVVADMNFTGGELLGSYSATITWNAAVLSFVALEPGDGFPMPEFNDANVAAGELRIAQANSSGAGGSPVLARIRFSTIGSGTTETASAITEMSAAITFTDLLSNVVVTNGTVSVN